MRSILSFETIKKILFLSRVRNLKKYTVFLISSHESSGFCGNFLKNKSQRFFLDSKLFFKKFFGRKFSFCEKKIKKILKIKNEKFFIIFQIKLRILFFENQSCLFALKYLNEILLYFFEKETLFIVIFLKTYLRKSLHEKKNPSKLPLKLF